MPDQEPAPTGLVANWRIELATALIRAGAGDDEGVIFEWHPCVDTPACRAAADPKSPCACSGIPYLSDAAWSELAPIVRRIQPSPAWLLHLVRTAALMAEETACEEPGHPVGDDCDACAWDALYRAVPQPVKAEAERPGAVLTGRAGI